MLLDKAAVLSLEPLEIVVLLPIMDGNIYIFRLKSDYKLDSLGRIDVCRRED